MTDGCEGLSHPKTQFSHEPPMRAQASSARHHAAALSPILVPALLALAQVFPLAMSHVVLVHVINLSTHVHSSLISNHSVLGSLPYTCFGVCTWEK